MLKRTLNKINTFFNNELVEMLVVAAFFGILFYTIVWLMSALG